MASDIIERWKESA